jgi:hypothetical protein
VRRVWLPLLRARVMEKNWGDVGRIMAQTDSIDYIWAAVGVLLALPGVLFIVFANVERMRALSLLGAFIGTLAGYPITLFIWGVAMDSVHLEGAVVLTGFYFIASMTGLVGALLVNFLFGGSNPPPRSTQVEF